MKKIKIAINGFGRIGRAFFKMAKEREEIAIMAVNDLGSKEAMEYLLKYDSVYGQSPYNLDGVKYLSEKEPAKLPWKDLDIDVVVESTGHFTTFESARVHLNVGAKKVVISAPAKDDPSSNNEATVLLGVNDDKLGTCNLTSNASCTTNATSPIIAILDGAIGIEKAVLNTVHAYTASQALVDGPSRKDLREGRAAAQNIVPSTTGAAVAVTKAFPKLKGLFDGISLRVPVPIGSIADVTFIAEKNTTVEEVNEILKKAAGEDRWKGIFTVTEEELVSKDIIGNTHAAIADLSFTKVVGGNLVKVLSWYDNEMGYAHTLVEHVIRIGRQL